MENKSLIAKWIAKCFQEIEKKCESSECKKCQYSDICLKAASLNVEFKKKGYLK